MKYPLYKNGSFWTLLISLLILMALSSCQKVIDVKLDDADKKLVVDAVITDHAGGCVVRLSKTKKFGENNALDGVGGATVNIRDEAGTVTSLVETAPGIYTHDQLKGVSGETYQLSVVAEGKAYSATSTMPINVPLDSVYMEKQIFFNNEQMFSNVVFSDPGGTSNYYLFKQFVNGTVTNGIFLTDDELSDGKKIKTSLYLFADEEKKIKHGDEVMIEMHCIDKAVYKYWYSFKQSASGNGGAATPANPVSNISGGALGYFSAETVQSKTVVAP